MKQWVMWNPPATTKIRDPGGDPFAFLVLVGERKWDKFEDPPQRHSLQLVVDTLNSVLGILRIHLAPVLGRGSALLLGLVCALVLTKSGGDVPPSERIPVE